MADNDQAQAGAVTDDGNVEQVFRVQRIYVKDSSFEAPQSPDCFRKAYNPKVDFSINTQSVKIADVEDTYEVVLKMTADVKQDDKTLFLVEVQQAGLFEIKGFKDADTMTQVINTTCPTILFPYGRQAIDSMLNLGSFPGLMLAPVNFESIFVQAQKQRAEQEAAGNSESSDSH